MATASVEGRTIAVSVQDGRAYASACTHQQAETALRCYRAELTDGALVVEVPA